MSIHIIRRSHALSKYQTLGRVEARVSRGETRRTKGKINNIQPIKAARHEQTCENEFQTTRNYHKVTVQITFAQMAPSLSR